MRRVALADDAADGIGSSNVAVNGAVADVDGLGIILMVDVCHDTAGLVLTGAYEGVGAYHAAADVSALEPCDDSGRAGIPADDMGLDLAVGDLSALEELAGDAAYVVVVTGDGRAFEDLALVHVAFRELAGDAAKLLAAGSHVTLDGAAGDVGLGCAADDSAHCGYHRDALEVAGLLVVDETLD